MANVSVLPWHLWVTASQTTAISLSQHSTPQKRFQFCYAFIHHYWLAKREILYIWWQSHYILCFQGNFTSCALSLSRTILVVKWVSHCYFSIQRRHHDFGDWTTCSPHDRGVHRSHCLSVHPPETTVNHKCLTNTNLWSSKWNKLLKDKYCPYINHNGLKMSQVLVIQ